jgi:hypothetical protein
MTQPNITVNIFNYADPATVVIDDLSGIAQAIQDRALVTDPEPVPRIVPTFTGRMTDNDRRQLWAAWNNYFTSDTSDTERWQFTRTVLGLRMDEDTSWSRNGSLTSDQAYHLIRVLTLLAEIG